ncbi:MAG: signal peptidase I [Hyphomicrobiales bacterium]
MRIRRKLLVFLALAGIVSAAPRLGAATLTDWIESARIANLFVSAGIQAKSYLEPTTKMMPNLVEGDVVLADLRLAGKQPERGELILSWYQGDTVYIDRVIGLPGERIAFLDGRLILNGKEITQEPAGKIDYDAFGRRQTRSLFVETLPGARPYKIARNLEGGGFFDNIPETAVSPGRLYLLGDNRDDSVDSRVASRGQVAIEAVIGRIVYRLRPNAGWLVPRETVQGLPKG